MLVLQGLVHTMGNGVPQGRENSSFFPEKSCQDCQYVFTSLVEAQSKGRGLLPTATGEGVALTHLAGGESAVEP